MKSTFLIVELSFGGEIIWNPHSDDGLLLARLKNQSLDEEMDQIRKVRSCRVSDNIKTGKLKYKKHREQSMFYSSIIMYYLVLFFFGSYLLTIVLFSAIYLQGFGCLPSMFSRFETQNCEECALKKEISCIVDGTLWVQQKSLVPG